MIELTLFRSPSGGSQNSLNISTERQLSQEDINLLEEMFQLGAPPWVILFALFLLPKDER